MMVFFPAIGVHAESRRKIKLMALETNFTVLAGILA